jgi:hypothetical protein
MVRVQKIGVEVICEKAHELVEPLMCQELDDTRAFDWWHKTWSLKSGYGRWAICHGDFGGFVTNASVERGHREDKEPCNEKSTLGEYNGNRFRTIRAQGEEWMNKLAEVPQID